MDFWRCYSFDFPHVEGSIHDDNTKLTILCKGLENKQNVCLTLQLEQHPYKIPLPKQDEEKDLEEEKKDGSEENVKEEGKGEDKKEDADQDAKSEKVKEIEEKYSGWLKVGDDQVDIELTASLKF